MATQVTTPSSASAAYGLTSATPQGSSRMGKDEFMKLLLAQIGAQDPLSPMDNQAFVAQLAQFSNLEQMQTMNGSLEALLVAQASSNQTQVANLVGKDVVYVSDTVQLPPGGGPATLLGNLTSGATEVTATITDANGKVVRTVRYGAHEAGDVALAWDGRDDQGRVLPEGSYKVQLAAADVNGDSVPIASRGKARVTGVSFAEGFPQLLLGTTRINLASVVEILQAP